MGRFRTLCTTLIATFLFLGSNVAQAADDLRLVVLDIPGGGTDLVLERVDDIPASIEVKNQKWFLKQVKKRGFKPKKILSRSRDLKYIIKGGKIDYILAVAPKGDTFEVRIIDKSGKPKKKMKLGDTTGGFTEEDADAVTGALSTVMGFAPAATEDEENVEDEEEEIEEENEDEEEDQEEDPGLISVKSDDSGSSKAGLSNFLWLELKPQLMKHDMSFAGANGALLTYNSAFYPGVQLEAEIYVGALIPDSDASGAGVFLGATLGSDKIKFDDGGELNEAGLFHLEIEAGLLYRVDSLMQNSSTGNIRARFRITARHIQYNVDSPALPETSLTSINIVGKIAYPLFFDNFALEGMVTFTPFGIYGKSSELFGNSSTIYGFGTQLGVVYGLGEIASVTAGYGFRLLRTQFSGQGVSDFDNTQAFDLVQGLQAGLAIQF